MERSRGEAIIQITQAGPRGGSTHGKSPAELGLHRVELQLELNGLHLLQRLLPQIDRQQRGKLPHLPQERAQTLQLSERDTIRNHAREPVPANLVGSSACCGNY